MTTETENLPDVRTTKVSHVDREAEMLKALNGLSPKLRAEYEFFRKAIDESVSDGLKLLWQLGERARKIHSDEHNYGAGAIKQLSLALAYDQSTIYLAMRFSVHFDKEDLNDLLHLRRKKSGACVTWAHVSQLVQVADRKLRVQFLRQLVNEDLSPEELGEEIKKIQGSSGREGVGGANLRIPETAKGVLANVVQQSYFWTRNYEKMWDKLQEKIEQTPADKMDPDFMKKLDESIQYMDRVHEDATQMRTQLLAAKELALLKVEKHAQAQGSTEASKVESNGKHTESNKGRKGGKHTESNKGRKGGKKRRKAAAATA